MEKHVTQLLFVYGTLLLPENMYARFLLENATLCSPGKFPGELFDLGAYPGAVINYDKDEFVFGKIFKMNDPDQILETLDDYEGLGEANCEYERIIIEVSTTDGAVQCYSYIYVHPTSSKTKIEGGNYLRYLENKA
ncbi:gamma-glutamylcyclotransferase family protein [Desertivirga brevis]|uniref:gamma-glutamylcyclotransferase family protein n=1 Tax=Desertivirga brevis TaxID=2810310 RepID=UPI001A964740|nr:gamma-glutamylcyclotransferase family protein [Pedobacter sp. SYSU D00873]